MSGLREVFEEIAADVPLYGDLDRAIEQAERERRQRYGLVAGLAAAAAVVAVVVGVLVIARDGHDTAPPISPTPTPATPTPPPKSQSPQTWADTPLAGTHDDSGWQVPDPLTMARSAWFAIAADHLDPTGDRLDPQGDEGSTFTWRVDGSLYAVEGSMGVVADRSERSPFDGCSYLMNQPPPSNGTESCSDERLEGPHGERARISRWERRCDTWDPGSPGDDARPGPGATYETCGDFRVAVAVERRDGRIGFLVADGRGTTDYNPFSPEAMVAAAADRRLTLPDEAFEVPSSDVAMSVVADHLPSWRPDPQSTPIDQPGYAAAWGKLGRNALSMRVLSAGRDPVCGRDWLVGCVERRVFGAGDPTTVFVGAWDDEDWADCCPRNSRAFNRQFVYVGPEHTVVVWLSRILSEHEAGIGAELDQRVIDLLLDPRLQ